MTLFKVLFICSRSIKQGVRDLETKQLEQELSNVKEDSILEYVLRKYPHETVFTTSFGPEDQVIIHKISKQPEVEKPLIITLDTGRLFDETYRLMDETSKKLNMKIELIFPDYSQVEAFISKNGINCFYDSLELRKECCRIRKVEPLKRALKNKKIWITGLRRQQSHHREKMTIVKYDEVFQVIKINPLVNWDIKMVWNYIKKNGVSFNELHKKGYLSIGCACCTRSIHPGEDEREGRWWWEQESKKECGLHLNIKNGG